MTMALMFRAVVPALDPNRDGFSNSFVFQSDTATVYTGLGPIFTAIENFYNTMATGASAALNHYLGHVLDTGTNHATINAYDITTKLNGQPVGSPVATVTWTLSGVGNNSPLPEGVAACINSSAIYGTDVEFGPTAAIPTPPDLVADYGAATTHQGHTRPRARDRNRLYLGPLDSATLTQNATTKACIFTPGFITDCLAAAFALNATITSGSDSWNQRIWSRAAGTLKMVNEFFMDDRPDYQRRRSDSNPGARVYHIGQGA